MYWQIGLLLADIGRCLDIENKRGLLHICSFYEDGQCEGLGT